ncbi:MAG TPA: hypothetical protein ENN78_02720 [Candidatus Omnitrophica bacterium]|nr:hypothetical protein [Candidatus Omnitrophota bacterium]
MKIIGVIMVLFLVYPVFASMLGPDLRVIPESGISDNSSQAKPCFAAIEGLIKKHYGVENIADLGENGVNLQQDLRDIYSQLIFGTLALTTTGVGFDLIEL